jgi:hypothetical protein
MDEGLHVPMIPLGEVAFKVGAASPEHNVKAVIKSGIIVLVIDTTKVTGEAH